MLFPFARFAFGYGNHFFDRLVSAPFVATLMRGCEVLIIQRRSFGRRIPPKPILRNRHKLV